MGVSEVFGLEEAQGILHSGSLFTIVLQSAELIGKSEGKILGSDWTLAPVSGLAQLLRGRPPQQVLVAGVASVVPQAVLNERDGALAPHHSA
jgi:hypothetical protein